MSASLLGALVVDTAIGIAVLSSPSWVRFCVGGTACTSMHTTGVLSASSFCMHEPRCMDALQFGVFMMLCVAMLCRAWLLYTAGVALYHVYHPEQLPPQPFRQINGLVVMLQILATVVAQYTFFLVIFLKLNGDQHASFSNVLWPFYLSWSSIVIIAAIFYFQPTTTEVLPAYSRKALPAFSAASLQPALSAKRPSAAVVQMPAVVARTKHTKERSQLGYAPPVHYQQPVTAPQYAVHPMLPHRTVAPLHVLHPMPHAQHHQAVLATQHAMHSTGHARQQHSQGPAHHPVGYSKK